MDSLEKTKKDAALAKKKAYLMFLNDEEFISGWMVPENRLDRALFRIQVAHTLIAFFELDKRGNTSVVEELLNPYERGVDDAIKEQALQYVHPDYDQGHKDYLLMMEQ